ncbi:hypothetical protein KEM60_01259 [Austwickia sp. TVS 96-490-7B]|nr:hypothetical protein [Austwickia sp. TVS 96-490-7B]
MKVCVALAVVSALFNICVPPEMSGDWQVYSFVRKSISKVLSSGSVWAAVALYAGWKAPRPRLALVAGVAAAEGTLLVHYLLGVALGIYEMNILWSNNIWFFAGVLYCGPLGLCGWYAARAGWLGLAARMIVPVGAVLEPFVLRHFDVPYQQIPWPERYSNVSSGVLLVVLGVVTGAFVLQRGPYRLISVPPAEAADPVDEQVAGEQK